MRVHQKEGTFRLSQLSKFYKGNPYEGIVEAMTLIARHVKAADEKLAEHYFATNETPYGNMFENAKLLHPDKRNFIDWLFNIIDGMDEGQSYASIPLFKSLLSEL